MRLIIVRHGKAEMHSPSGKDEDRRLKPRGKRQAEFLAAHFAKDDQRPELILASRFERAIATAHVIQKATGSPLELARQLEVGHASSSASDLVAAHASRSSLMLVGHNPQLADLVWALTRGLPPQDSGLRTGEAVVLEIDPANLIGTAKELARIRHGEED
jgi:phosphohistidine phosphatase